MTDLVKKYQKELAAMRVDADANLKEALEAEDLAGKELAKAKENLRQAIKACRKRRFFGEAFKLIWFSLKRKQTTEIPKRIVAKLQEFIKNKENLPKVEDDVRQKKQLAAECKDFRVKAQNCVTAIETLQRGGEIPKPQKKK